MQTNKNIFKTMITIIIAATLYNAFVRDDEWGFYCYVNRKTADVKRERPR